MISRLTRWIILVLLVLFFAIIGLLYKYGNTKIYYISPFDISIAASVNKIAFTTKLA